MAYHTDSEGAAVEYRVEVGGVCAGSFQATCSIREAPITQRADDIRRRCNEPYVRQRLAPELWWNAAGRIWALIYR